MKTWRLIMGMAVATGLLIACSDDPEKNEDDSGDGGSGGTSTTTATTTTTGTTTTSTATTSTGMDCASQGAQCGTCCNNSFPGGQTQFQALISCLVCDACYTTCDGAAQGCPSGPPTPDACDGASAEPTACNNCVACAQDDGSMGNPQGSCFPALESCNNNPDCAAIIQCVNSCPQ